MPKPIKNKFGFSVLTVTMRPLILTFSMLCSLFCFWRSAVCGDNIYQTPETETYLKTVFTTENGLPQNSVTSIVQTKDNYIWLATFGGLARFDGIKFTLFTTSNTPQLINNRLIALYEDRHGVLWIGSEDGDLMNYQNGVFSLIKKSEGMPKDGRIQSFWLDHNDILWFASIGTLRSYNLQTKEFKVFTSQEILNGQLKPNELFNTFWVTEDTENTLWLTTSRGLIRYRDGKFTQLGTTGNLSTNIGSIKLNPNGGIWVASDGNVGVYKDGIYTPVIDLKNDDSNTPLLNISRNNHLFFSKSFAGKEILYEFVDGKVKTFEYSGLGTRNIRANLIDNEGNFWIGSDDGLTQLKRRTVQTFGINENGQKLGVQAIIEDSLQNIWATSAKNLIRFNHGKAEFVTKSNDFFTTLAIDRNNVIWLGKQNGIAKFENNKLTNYEDSFSSDRAVTSLFFDKDGTLWIGKRNAGLQQFKDEKFNNYTTVDGLVNNSILYLTQSRSGALLIGTKGGLSQFENGKFTNYSTENGLANNQVRDIFEDADGNLWIGTYGGGISRLRDGKIVSITSKNGLAEDIASRILTDDRDNFWVMGNQGIYVVNRNLLNDFADGKTKRVYCRVYNIKDGMETSEGNGGNQPAGWKTKDGKLWFPMIYGGVIIDPQMVRFTSAPVYVEGVSLEKNEFSPRNKLEINPGQGNLEINYTAIEFTKPEQLQFRYKLEGYDSDWQDVGTRRTAYYSYLPPGTYKFVVTATNSGNFWSEKDAVLEIVVYAPFWRTWWFYSLVILGLILLIVAGYQIRLGQLKQKRLQQESFARQLINAHESERSRIAGELHDSLGQTLLIIKNWSLLVSKKLPVESEEKKQVEEIVGFTTSALEETRTIARNLRPSALKKFGLTETLALTVKHLDESSDINFKSSIENIDKLFSADDELSIYRIVQECLNNVLKHSKAKKATVRIEKTSAKIDFTNAQDVVMIEIKDDGQGFNYQAKRESGFGLENIEQRVQLLGGKYSIKSNARKGTTITITLAIK
ncbi:MAG: hypothetical protein K1X72_25230 [Pyrinomonadaceae bacterium]|nr:hypothetical protein [Pyrinomonadaceae bacterium]